MDHPQIVVAVDGSAASWRALRWAARHARTTGRDLLVAYLSEAGEHLGDYGFGDGLAADVVVALTRDHPSLAAHTVVIDGNPADFLLLAAADAAMLVLGRETGSSLMSLGSALATILARSECPVVVTDGVEADASTSPRMIVGVSDSAGGRAALHFACREALRSHVPVLAVRSSSEPDVLAASLDDARARYPGVEISGLLTTEATRFALARESHDADLVALGCRSTSDGRRRRPGAETLLAVYSLSCAVAVVGPETVDRR